MNLKTIEQFKAEFIKNVGNANFWGIVDFGSLKTDACNEALVTLHNSKEVDVIKQVFYISESCYPTEKIICDILPRLDNISLESYFKVVKHIKGLTDNSELLAVSDFFTKNQNLCIEFIQQVDSAYRDYIVHLSTAVSVTESDSFTLAYDKLWEIKDDAELRREVIFSLSQLDYGDHHNEFDKVLNLYTELVTNDDLKDVIATSCRGLAKYSINEIFILLNKLLVSANADVRSRIIEAVWFNLKNFTQSQIGELTYKSLNFVFDKFPSWHTDKILMFLLKHDELRFLESLQLTFTINRESVSWKDLYGLGNELKTNTNISSIIITDWLIDGKHTLNLAAEELINFIAPDNEEKNYLSPLVFHKECMEELSPEQVCLLIEKTYAFTVNKPNEYFSLIFSILKWRDEDKIIDSIQSFMLYVAVSFKPAWDFFYDGVKCIQRRESLVVNYVKKNSDLFFNEYSQLSMPNELKIPDDKLMKFQTYESDMFRKGVNEGQKGSFMALCTTIAVKAGSGFFSRVKNVDGEEYYTSKSKFTPITSSVLMPLHYKLDPVDFDMLWRKCRGIGGIKS